MHGLPLHLPFQSQQRFSLAVHETGSCCGTSHCMPKGQMHSGSMRCHHRAPQVLRPRPEHLQQLQTALDYDFTDVELLRQACIHPSCAGGYCFWAQVLIVSLEPVLVGQSTCALFRISIRA